MSGVTSCGVLDLLQRVLLIVAGEVNGRLVSLLTLSVWWLDAGSLLTLDHRIRVCAFVDLAYFGYLAAGKCQPRPSRRLVPLCLHLLTKPIRYPCYPPYQLLCTVWFV